MVLIFDLDDTLYPERSYVLSGLRAVARFGHEHFGLSSRSSFKSMRGILDEKGRGTIFDQWLKASGIYSKKNVHACVKYYRQHSPDIRLFPIADQVLKEYRTLPLYLVTDGHKIAQSKKVQALGLEKRFKRIFITHRFGIKHAKPSVYCFQKIRQMERCNWTHMIYVGDNPAKDFVNLNPLGVHTVRVLTGRYRYLNARPGHDATAVISSLDDLGIVLPDSFGS